MSLLRNLPDNARELGQAYGHLIKVAGDAVSAPVLSGRLYLSKSGWLLLSVPNGLVRGIFDTLDEEGLEIPPGKNGQPYDAHISVMRKEEVESIGGGDVITERGKSFHYQFGPLKTVAPAGWDEMSKVWFVEVQSQELRNLRKSYGLPGLPQRNGEELQFHITVAVRRKKVLQENEVAKKAAGWDDSHYFRALTRTPLQLGSGGIMANLLAHLRKVKANGDASISQAQGARRLNTAFLSPLARQRAMHNDMLSSLRGVDPVANHPLDKALRSGFLKISSDDLDALSEVKARSDLQNYAGKHLMLRQLIAKDPAAWRIDSRRGNMVGLTHRSGYRFHAPQSVASALPGG